MKDELKSGYKKIIYDLKNKNIKNQIPNILTSIRLLAPFILIPLIYFNKLNISLFVVIILALTDAFDGYFARKFNAFSTFGKYLDAVTDKIFVLTLLIPFILKTTISSNNYLIVIIIIFEFLIGLINVYAFFRDLNPQTTKFGKIKTIFLFSFLGILYLNTILEININFIYFLAIIINLLQISAIISYINQIKNNKKMGDLYN